MDCNGYIIIGTGIDIIENRRMAEMLEKWGARFKDRIFLRREQEYCESKAVPVHHYAGRFAVKEAVAKAFGTGIGEHINWLDIEVIRDNATGAPSVTFSEKVNNLLAEKRADGVLISLSHAKSYAVAQASLVARHIRK